jgi:hypothetical protein
MTFQRFVFKTHKWLAVGVGLFTFFWFLTGIVMILPLLRDTQPPSVAQQGEAPARDSHPYRQVAVSVPQAIAAAEAAAGHPLPVTSVSFRALPGRLAYEIGTNGAGVFLINSVDGARVVITPELAGQIAADALQQTAAWRTPVLLREHTSEYKHPSLPAYRLEADDAQHTVYYISAQTGEVLQGSTRLGRLRGMLVGIHTFGFLRPQMDNRAANLTLAGFAAAGLLMSVFGMWILGLQLLNWLRAHRRVV